MGESHAVRMMISDISKTRNQLYEYIAATVHFSPFVDRILLKCFIEKDSHILKLIMYERHRRTNFIFMLT